MKSLVVCLLVFFFELCIFFCLFFWVFFDRHCKDPNYGINAKEPLYERKKIAINAILPDAFYVTFLQFNMLADGLSGSRLSLEENPKKGFIKAPQMCLQWEYRRWRILEHLIQTKSSFICLQECDQFTVFSFFFLFFACVQCKCVYVCMPCGNI